MNTVAPAIAPGKTRSRYALVGAGHRAQMYIDAISRRFAGSAELLAWSDTNPGRLDFYDELIAARDIDSPARYEPSQLPAMIKDLDIDTVVVTSPDFTHAAVIETCLRAGADVVVEKPLTIDAAGCASIAAAVRETGRRVTVTFNYRYSPRNSALKEVIASGEIGAVTSVNFEWVLDTVHGADYFRRWHREKAKSGGLLIHKASHHFDLVNWWIDDQPHRVYASGALSFYGAANARKRGLDRRPERGTGDSPRIDPFAMDLREDERLRRLYLDNEHHDGYLRDRDVFADGITIEDNLAVIVDYAGGPTLNYSLNAHSPWEGYRVAINGTKGRAELEVVERGAADEGAKVLDPSATAELGDQGRIRPRGERLLVQRHWEQAREVPIADFGGAHGGGDDMLLADLFGNDDARAADPLRRPAGYLDGVASVAVGIAGNRSLETGQPVLISELLGASGI
jgi:predicted dehydrogenase